MKKWICLILIIHFVAGQGLFESASGSSLSFNLRGEIQTGLFLAQRDDSLYVKQYVGLADISLSGNTGQSAFGSLSMRILQMDSDPDSVSIDLREMTAGFELSDFRLSFGYQILRQARSDVFTLFDNFVSSDRSFLIPDDHLRFLPTWTFLADYQVSPGCRGRFVLQPDYIPDKIPVDSYPLPENVSYLGVLLPDISWNNPSVATILYFTGKTADVSLIYQRIRHPQFLFDYSLDPGTFNVSFYGVPYFLQIAGFDAAFSFGEWNTRLEMAAFLQDKNADLSPKTSFQWTLGMDRTVSNLTFLIEYHGNFIPDYEELPEALTPSEEIDFMFKKMNRMYSGQTGRLVNSVFIRPSTDLFHQNVSLELPFLFNFETKEYMLSLRADIRAGAGLTVKIGGDYFHGDDETLFGYTAHIYNSVFTVLQYEF